MLWRRHGHVLVLVLHCSCNRWNPLEFPSSFLEKCCSTCLEPHGEGTSQLLSVGELPSRASCYLLTYHLFDKVAPPVRLWEKWFGLGMLVTPLNLSITFRALLNAKSSFISWQEHSTIWSTAVVTIDLFWPHREPLLCLWVLDGGILQTQRQYSVVPTS